MPELVVVVLGDTVPHELAEQVTVQVTPALFGSLVTVAVNCWVMVAITVAVWGSTSTTIAGTVNTALATASELPTAVAVTVTCKSLAGGAGAVYVMGTPLRLEDAERLPHGGAAQEIVQVTP